MAAGNATGSGDGLAAIPQNARMGIFPANRKGFIHLQILASLDAAPAKNALVGVITVKGIGIIHLIWLGPERPLLVLHFHQRGSIVDRAVLVVVVANRAIEFVVPRITSMAPSGSLRASGINEYFAPSGDLVRTPGPVCRSLPPCRYRRFESAPVAGGNRFAVWRGRSGQRSSSNSSPGRLQIWRHRWSRSW